MTDLTKITTPFGLLDAETQQALRDAFAQGKELEIYRGERWEHIKGPNTSPAWSCQYTYRVRPGPETTTVYVNLWRSSDGRVFATSRAEYEASISPQPTRALIARETITIPHGKGLK